MSILEKNALAFIAPRLMLYAGARDEVTSNGRGGRGVPCTDFFHQCLRSVSTSPAVNIRAAAVDVVALCPLLSTSSANFCHHCHLLQ